MGESQSAGVIERCKSSQNIESCVGASHGNESPARRKDKMLAGGICCLPDEPVRCRRRREDAALMQSINAVAAWPKGQHTHSGFRREDPVHAGQASEREKVGTAIPSRSVCGDAELVNRGSGRHRARDGDQDTLTEHQKNP